MGHVGVFRKNYREGMAGVLKRRMRHRHSRFFLYPDLVLQTSSQQEMGWTETFLSTPCSSYHFVLFVSFPQ